MSTGRFLAAAALAAIIGGAVAAPALGTADPRRQNPAFPYAPPMRPHVRDDDGVWRMPFVYPLRLIDRLERTYAEDRSRSVSLLPQPPHGAADPDIVFLLGSDALGRDVLSRLLLGARVSLGVAAGATVGALLLGMLLGTAAGYVGGMVDEVAMRLTEMVVVLPALYVALALRVALPLVLEPVQVMAGLAGILSCLGWPMVARGVRAIVAAESRRDYVTAARACGASPARLVLRHVLPAARGFLVTQAALLVPAFAIAEATLSFAGFGFAEPTPSWGTMLQETGNVRILGECPWLLAPAVLIAAVSVALHTLSDAAKVQPLGG